MKRKKFDKLVKYIRRVRRRRKRREKKALNGGGLGTGGGDTVGHQGHLSDGFGPVSHGGSGGGGGGGGGEQCCHGSRINLCTQELIAKDTSAAVELFQWLVQVIQTQ